MPGVDFHQLRHQISISDVLRLLAFTPCDRMGDQLRGPCPIHGSSATSRTFSVSLQRNAFRCFKCGAEGNQLDLWAAATKQPLFEAGLDLCERLGLQVPWIACRAPTKRRYS